MPQIPLLVVEEATSEPGTGERVTARLRVGGHPGRVVLDFSRRRLGLVEYLEVPALLDLHPPTMHAVVRFLERVVDGEPVDFPTDLTEDVETDQGPSPFAPLPPAQKAALDRLADSVPIEVLSCERDVPEAGQVTLQLKVAGRTVRLVAEVHAGPELVSVIRWLQGPDREAFSEAERHAIDRLLMDSSERQ